MARRPDGDPAFARPELNGLQEVGNRREGAHPPMVRSRQQRGEKGRRKENNRRTRQVTRSYANGYAEFLLNLKHLPINITI